MPGPPSPTDHLNPAAPSRPRRRLRSVSLTLEYPQRWTPNPTPSFFEPTPTLEENGTTDSILSPRGRQLVEREGIEFEEEEARQRAIAAEEYQAEKRRVYESLAPAQQDRWRNFTVSVAEYLEWLDKVLDPYERFEGGLWMFDEEDRGGEEGEWDGEWELGGYDMSPWVDGMRISITVD